LILVLILIESGILCIGKRAFLVWIFNTRKLTDYRQRRVKCDETKPGCNRCQALGRECGGYAPEMAEDSSKQALTPVTIHPRPLTSMSYSPTVSIPGDAEERRYFQRFCDKTSKELCGAFDPKFWTEKVLQLCHHDPPIRLAVIALGALAKSLEVTSFPTKLSLSGFPQIDHHHLDEHHQYALRHYSKAVASLRTILNDGRRHLRTSLTSCVLFMCFEAFQGNYDGSLTHLRGGTRLLADWRLARRGLAARLSQDSRSEIQDGLVDDLGRMFARLDAQGLFVPPPFPTPELPWEDVVVPDSFDSTQEAREQWDFLFCGIAQLYRQSITHSQQSPEELLTPAWLEMHEHYTKQLLQWRTSFQGIFVEELHSGAIRADMSTVLSIYYNLATILLAASVQHTEMIFDEYNHLFAEILSKCNHLLSNTDDPSNTSRFTLDVGTILPLAITATKCRDRRIRRQSIALLWSHARREGLCFDTITVARLCAWLSSIEGEGVQDDSEPILEPARQMITYLNLSSDERWMAVQLTSSVLSPNGTHAYRETTFSW